MKKELNEELNEELDLRYQEKKKQLEKEIKQKLQAIKERKEALKRANASYKANNTKIVNLTIDIQEARKNDDVDTVTKKEKELAELRKKNTFVVESKKELDYWDARDREEIVKKEVELELIELNLTKEKRKVRNAILKKKGVYKIFLKSVEERTVEENRKLEKALKEAVKEISEIKIKEVKDKKEEAMTISEIIQVLYNTESKVKWVKGKKPRKAYKKTKEIKQVKENADKEPIAINKNVEKKTVNSEVPAAPSDLEGTFTPGKVNVEKLIIYSDPNAIYYMRKDVYEKQFNRKKSSYYVLPGVEDQLINIMLFERDELLKKSKNGEIPYEIEIVDSDKPVFNIGIKFKTPEDYQTPQSRDEIFEIPDFLKYPINDEETIEGLGNGTRAKFTASSSGVRSSNKFSRNLLRDKYREYTIHLKSSAEKLVDNLPPSLQHLVGDPIKAMSKFDFWTNPKIRMTIEKIHKYINDLTDDKLDMLLEKKDKLIDITKNKIVNSMLLHKIKEYSKKKLDKLSDMMVDMMANNNNLEMETRGMSR